MKPFALFLLLFFISCQKKEETILTDTKSATTPKPTPEYLTDSLTIDGKTFTLLQGFPGNNDLPLRILFGGDTIYRHGAYSANGFELRDLDENGIMDVELNYLSNVGGIKEWVVFDAKSGTFRNIVNLVEFPSPEKLAGTKYYYSDHRMGCAGGMWGSELFQIDDYEAKAIARIFIVTCIDADYAKGVTIYKLDGKKETILQQMVKMPEEYSTEADFFKAYWSKNYRKFE